jgi:hypothetical protein
VGVIGMLLDLHRSSDVVAASLGCFIIGTLLH